VATSGESSGNRGSSAASALHVFPELEHAQAHLAAIVASSEDAIVSKTLEGIVTSWNAAAERLFGYSSAEMVGQSILRIIPAEKHAEEAEILAKIRAGQRIERYETVRVHKSGRRLELSLTISPVKDAAGRVVGAAKIAHDIARRREMEHALKEEAAALETLNEVGQAVASQLDLGRIVQLVTDAATHLTGAAFGAFFYNVGKEESYLLHSLSGAAREAFASFPMPRITEVFGPTFRGEGVVRSADIHLDTRYGHNSPFAGLPPGHLPVRSYLAVPVALHNGEVIGGLLMGHPQPGVFSERSERLAVGIAAQASIAMANARLFESLREQEKRLKEIALEREALLQSERSARAEAERLGHLKDEFLATLSHELRTPLNAIHGWTTLLKHKGSNAADRERGLETIERNVRAQTRIVNDLLDMSRIISGKVHLEIQPLQLHAIIESAVETLQQAADAKRIRVQRILDSGIGCVRGDPHRLQQVLWNLLTNAIKFTPAGGTVRVRLKRDDSQVQISVEDTGVGIEPEFLPYVFDRFRQADATITRRYGGLGLGLSIVKTLVELHGGSVRVRSAGQNQGSSFVVELPIFDARIDERAQVVEPPTGPGATPVDSELPRLDGIRVLIVDDDDDGRTLLGRILEAQGACATTAASAIEGLDRLRAQPFDILLSDIGMPDVDGYQFLRRVRALDGQRPAPLPAIAITAYARPDDRNRSLLAGYNMHLSKPIEAPELLAGMASLLHLAR
jgi:PAS domain S-box-containing protein